jgi:hypothetical protein
MKYLINSTRGNGYGCSCCSHYEDNTDTADTLDEAVSIIAYIFAKDDYRLSSFDDITPIPENPNDFILKDGEYVPNFNKEHILNLAKELSKKYVQKMKEDKLKAQEELNRSRERLELAELERLKRKYESR